MTFLAAVLVIGLGGPHVSLADNDVVHKHCGHPPAPCVSASDVFCGMTTAGMPIPGPRQFLSKKTCCHCDATQTCWRIYKQEGGAVPAGHGSFFPVAVPHWVTTGKVECGPWRSKDFDPLAHLRTKGKDHSG
jgi:hypothetical protein